MSEPIKPVRGKPRPLEAGDLRNLADALDQLPADAECSLNGSIQVYCVGLEWRGEYDLHHEFINASWDTEALAWVVFVETRPTEDF